MNQTLKNDKKTRFFAYFSVLGLKKGNYGARAYTMITFTQNLVQLD